MKLRPLTARTRMFVALASASMLVLLGAPVRSGTFAAAGNTLYLPFIARECGNSLGIAVQTISHPWNYSLTTYQSVGTVVNRTSQSFKDVQLTLHVFDTTSGQELTSASSDAFLPELTANGASPFKLQWSNNPSASPTINWAIEATCKLSTTSSSMPLSVVSQHIDTTSAQPLVTGEVRNDESQSASSFVVALSIDDGVGGFLNTGVYTSSATLLPGATAPYTITLDEVYTYLGNVSDADLSVAAQGKLAP